MSRWHVDLLLIRTGRGFPRVYRTRFNALVLIGALYLAGFVAGLYVI